MLSGRDFTVDDIVQHVIEKTLCGERRWDPKQGALMPWLKNQVKSVMDAWIKRESGKYEMSFGDDQSENDEPHDLDNAGVMKIENTRDINSLQPETVLLEKEVSVEQSKVINRVFQAMSGDIELEELFDAITETGSTKPSVLADHLKVEINEINNLKKRFNRRLANL